MLRKQLVAPEIAHVNERFDMKINLHTEELKKELFDEIKRIEFQVNTKVSVVDEILF